MNTTISFVPMVDLLSARAPMSLADYKAARDEAIREVMRALNVWVYSQGFEDEEPTE